MGKYHSISLFKLFDKYGVKNCKIMLIKEYDVVDKLHLEMYETLWILRHKTAVNILKPFNIKWVYRRCHREKNIMNGRAYHAANVEKIHKRQKEYRIKNAEKIKQRQREKITCECGAVIARSGKVQHLKSEKHITTIGLLDD
jgi:hypothetical protein